MLPKQILLLENKTMVLPHVKNIFHIRTQHVLSLATMTDGDVEVEESQASHGKGRVKRK